MTSFLASLKAHEYPEMYRERGLLKLRPAAFVTSEGIHPAQDWILLSSWVLKTEINDTGWEAVLTP